MTGADLKSLRIKHGLSQVQLSHKIGVTRSAVCKWEALEDKPLSKRVCIQLTDLNIN